MKYSHRRQQWYTPLFQEGVFTWDRMDGEEYALANLHFITKDFQDDLALATQRLYQVFEKVGNVLHRGDDQLLLELGLPKETLPLMRKVIPDMLLTGIGRFDFAQTEQGLKMLEFNSDTPTGIVEAYYVNDYICRMLGVKNPNAGMNSHIPAAFQKMLTIYQRNGYSTENIVFSSLEWHVEDAGTTRYLLSQSGYDGRFVPLKDLRVNDEGLFADVHGELHPVDVLYRLHALEILAEEKDVDGYPSGALLLDLAARGKVALINPPSAFLVQSKGVQALIWNLHQKGVFFTLEEHEWIGQYILPTYFENMFLGKEAYVKKPVFGREGGGVTLFNKDGVKQDGDTGGLYGNQPMVYQKAVDLPAIQVETEKGSFAGRLLWGSFVMGGEPSALIARVGGRITNNGSYYLPIGLKGDAKHC